MNVSEKVIKIVICCTFLLITDVAYPQWNIINWSSTCEGELYSIKFKSIDTGFAVGSSHGFGDGIIMRTYNSGDSWETLNPGADCWVYADICYPSNNQIYVLGSWAEPTELPGGLILISEDHGNIWYAGAGTTETPYSFHCFNQDSCIIAGINNILFTSDIFGIFTIQWSFTDIGIDFGEIFSMHFYNDSCGYACGSYEDYTRGILLKTIDYGQSWEVVYQPIELINFNTVYACSEDTIYIGGQQKIHRSFDGGFEWFTSNLLTDLRFNDYNQGIKDIGNNGVINSIDFINDSVGFAVFGLEFEQFNHGEIFKTIDYGTNWIKQDEWTQLNSVNFITDSVGYIAGDCMTILKTSTLGGGINVGIEESNKNKIDVSAYPNPFTNQTTIEYTLNSNSKIQILIYNSLGELLFENEGDLMSFGTHEVIWSGSNLPAGFYFGVLRNEEGVSVVKIVKQ